VKKITGEWIRKAEGDYQVACRELETQPPIPEAVCFHAQQGVEKALKAFLRSRQRSVPQVHSLRELLAICQRLDADARFLKDACKTLDRYYIPTRYPDALPGTSPEGLPTRHDAEEAVELLRNALNWIEGRVR